MARFLSSAAASASDLVGTSALRRWIDSASRPPYHEVTSYPVLVRRANYDGKAPRAFVVGRPLDGFRKEITRSLLFLSPVSAAGVTRLHLRQAPVCHRLSSRSAPD